MLLLAYYISGWLLYVTVGITAAESMNSSASILYFRLAAVCHSGYNSCGEYEYLC
jgi:hypothetical protein